MCQEESRQVTFSVVHVIAMNIFLKTDLLKVAAPRRFALTTTKALSVSTMAAAFYKASKLRFDSDAEFKQRAQQAVVRIEGGETRYREAWTKICEINRTEFHRVYDRLGVQLKEKSRDRLRVGTITIVWSSRCEKVRH
ncbi:hypothetical protein RIF29_39338 [Crotalaria pallida]|uniref:Arginyl-tRNA synthetase catalytic core domain-containing protein n=1 Tax=Crotalaria pallida TaxID=3830 RepID=A0AAN9HME0_CROPI